MLGFLTSIKFLYPDIHFPTNYYPSIYNCLQELSMEGLGLTAVPSEVWESGEVIKLDLSRNSIQELPVQLSSCVSLQVKPYLLVFIMIVIFSIIFLFFFHIFLCTIIYCLQFFLCNYATFCAYANIILQRKMILSIPLNCKEFFFTVTFIFFV